MPRNNDFLNDFLGTNPPDPRKLSKNAVNHDRWDTEDFDRLLNEVKEFSASDDRLTDVVQTGHHAFADTYYSLVKADPHLLPSGQVRPTYQINRTVMDEVTQLKEYEELRTYCVGPNARVLTADLRWIAAADVFEGMSLLAFDEFPVADPGKYPYARTWRRSVVEKVQTIVRPCYDLTFSNGMVVRSSAEHLWLGRKATTLTWRKTEELIGHPTSGSRLARVLDVWDEDTSWDAGYLAAAFDGEGCLSQHYSKNPRSVGLGTGMNANMDLSFVQKDNAMFHEVQRILKELDYGFTVYPRKSEVNTIRITNTSNKLRRAAKRAEVLRFLGSIRPLRLLDNFNVEKLGTMNVIEHLRLVKKEYVGEQTVVAIKSTTATLVVNGIASHNCTGDDIGSALAVIQMEPKLEQLFDKAEQQQKLAEQLEQQMQQMVGMSEDNESLQDKIDRLMEQIDAGEAPDGSEQQLVDYQQQQSLIQQAMEMLAADMEATANELGAEANANAAAMKASIRQMLKDAVSEAKQNDTSALAWGLDPGVLHRLPADERLALAKRINSDRMRRIAELFGPMQRLAFAEQTRKTVHSREEVYDISQGNDISRLLPIEFMALEDEVLELDFFKRFVEGQLLQYELRGTEKLAKGGIVFCEDGSGSMTGDSELWAKAVGLCLLHIARAQKRSFYGIHFGGPKQIKCFDFLDTSSITPDRVIEFAECHFGGGTDFMTPLSKARDLLAEEFDRNGEVRGDIVFATDGMCGVDDKWFEAFKEEQERLGFRVYGIAIGCPTSSQPLAKICDHRVSTIKNLLTGGDVRDVFRAV